MKTQKYLTIWMIIVIFLMVISGCNNTNNASTEAIVVIDGKTISEAEIMLYLLQVKTQFEEVGGTDVWEIEDFSGGKNAVQVAKEGALANLFKDKILVGKASSMGVTMDAATKEQTITIAKQYFEQQIPEDMISKHKITQQIVIDTFLDFTLASEVETAIKDNFEPKEEQINQAMLVDENYATYKDYPTEEVLTKAKVNYIFTRTANVDENNEIEQLSEEEQKAAYDKIKEAYDQVVQGEDFDTISEQYSEVDQGEVNNEISVVQLRQFFTDLSIGNISEIAQTSVGYYIFQIIDFIEPTEEDIVQYDEQFEKWEATLREESIENLKKDAFLEIYSEWEKEVPKVVNNELWDQLSLF